jgi:hypothetical protein
MNDYSIAYLLGLDHTRREVLSALPDAPVVPDVAHRPGRTPVRRAAWLRTGHPTSRRRSVRLAGPTPCTEG